MKLRVYDNKYIYIYLYEVLNYIHRNKHVVKLSPYFKTQHLKLNCVCI